MRFAPILSVPARFNQKEPVPFQEMLPLKLKENVSGKGDKIKEVACIYEMSLLFACLKKTEFDQASCSKEIANFQKCFTTDLTQKRQKKEHEMKGILTPGEKKLSHKQVNQLLGRFPNKVK